MKKTFALAALALLMLPALAEPETNRTAQCAKKLKFMTYNIRCGFGSCGADFIPKGELGGLPCCAKIIREESPDWCAIQEIDYNTHRAGYTDQTAELAKLCGLHGEFADKPLEPQMCGLAPGMYGVASLSKTLPMTVRRYKFAGRKYHGRAILFAEFPDYWTVTTHFPLRDGELDLQFKLVDFIVSKMPGDGKPVFLAGDLNMTPDSESMAYLQKHFTLLTKSKGLTAPATEPSVRIDYVLVDNAHASKVRAKPEKIIENRYASDHFPVVVELQLEK